MNTRNRKQFSEMVPMRSIVAAVLSVGFLSIATVRALLSIAQVA